LRSGRAKNVIISGGATDARVKDAVEARVLAKQLEDWGIAKPRIFIEDASRNTHENAIYSERIVRERGFAKLVLVTSAAHMKRAAGCFYAAGLRFDTLPVDFHAYDPARFSSGIIPRTDALNASTGALHEYLGRLVYGIQGYTADAP
jgi:uncharacterized SAM-binding protein YcdF (DUF218 family)